MRLLFLLLLLYAQVAFAQDSTTNNILTTRKFRKGLYNSFKEFRDNSPQNIDFKVEADTGKYERFKLFNTSNKKIKNVYGFCDGSYLYINAKTYGQGNYFVRILLLGQIVYFEDAKGKSKAMTAESAGTATFFGGAVGLAIVHSSSEKSVKENPGWVVYMADNTGEPFILDPDTLSSIFEEVDHELNLAFKANRNNKKFDVLFDYMNRFNQRHPAK